MRMDDQLKLAHADVTVGRIVDLLGILTDSVYSTVELLTSMRTY
jgi:hypothetical protein